MSSLQDFLQNAQNATKQAYELGQQSGNNAAVQKAQEAAKAATAQIQKALDSLNETLASLSTDRAKAATPVRPASTGGNAQVPNRPNFAKTQ